MGVDIRRAAFADLPRILNLMEDAREHSAFVDASIDQQRAKHVLQHCIGISGQPRSGNSCTFVADNGPHIEAFLVGTIVPLYECLNISLATDLIWYARENASPRSGIGVLRAFHRWVEKCPGSVVIRHGITDAIADPDRTAKAFAASGFRQSGVIYQKEISR